MDETKRHRLRHLLRKNRRRNLAPERVEKWTTRGVAVSVLSDERQRELLVRLQTSPPPDYQPVRDVQSALRSFLGADATVTVVGWDANEEPALLVPAKAVLRAEADLRAIYPDGFVLIAESAALVVDFEEQLGEMHVAHCFLS